MSTKTTDHRISQLERRADLHVLAEAKRGFRGAQRHRRAAARLYGKASLEAPANSTRRTELAEKALARFDNLENNGHALELRLHLRRDMARFESEIGLAIFLEGLSLSERRITVMDWKDEERTFVRHKNPDGRFGGFFESQLSVPKATVLEQGQVMLLGERGCLVTVKSVAKAR